MPKDPKSSEGKAWCSSKEAKKALKVSDCELMHMRLSGKLEFKKSGNAYFYVIDTDKAAIENNSKIS
ncbi:hypothetical protein [Teredinibacter turnerae]|uniref:hypothetical protein n=1 Tax=Teredinibacter turnerae TaxID=2426 RepID=UPI00036249D4|nr:hypothetical protein [Teredinibacter turnerae]